MMRIEGNGWCVRWNAFELRVSYDRGDCLDDKMTPGDLRALGRAIKAATRELCSGSGSQGCMCNGCGGKKCRASQRRSAE